MPEATTAIAHRWFEEVWNQRLAATIDELLTPESVCFGDDGPIRGIEAFKQQMYAPLLAAFPDLQVEIHDTLNQGDYVVVRWSASGTHTGEGLGCWATHHPVQFTGMTWMEIRNGKLMQGWQSSNIPVVLGKLMAAGS